MPATHSNDFEQLQIEIRAIEKMLGTFQNMLDESFGGSDEYIEERMHLLNCRYAEILLVLEATKKTALTISQEKS